MAPERKPCGVWQRWVLAFTLASGSLGCPSLSWPQEAAPGPGEEGEEPIIDLDQVDVSEARPFQFHGRLDLAYVQFEDERNVDGHRRHQVLPISPGVYGEYRFLDRLALVAEVEYDGREESVEIDQAVLRLEAVKELLTLRLGRYYFPFGLEKSYYSPARNTLVDRPAAFRVVYPGTYADNGLFVEGKYTHYTSWTLGYEAALTQGLQGFESEDVPQTLNDNNRAPQVGGRAYFQPRKELTMGISYTLGFYDDTGGDPLDFFGFDIRFRLFDAEVRAEYVGGRVENTPEFRDFSRQGWYVHVEKEFEVGWKYLYSLVPVLRVDWVDPNDKETSFLDVTRYSMGLATFFLENLQLKAELSVSDERQGEISNNGFLLQAVFDW